MFTENSFDLNAESGPATAARSVSFAVSLCSPYVVSLRSPFVVSLSNHERAADHLTSVIPAQAGIHPSRASAPAAPSGSVSLLSHSASKLPQKRLKNVSFSSRRRGLPDRKRDRMRQNETVFRAKPRQAASSSSLGPACLRLRRSACAAPAGKCADQRRSWHTPTIAPAMFRDPQPGALEAR